MVKDMVKNQFPETGMILTNSSTQETIFNHIPERSNVSLILRGQLLTPLPRPGAGA